VIQSVAAQTYANIEHVIVDGGSTDGTVDVIRRHEDAIAFWLSEPDTGIYEAMNKGICASHGQLIAILNSDDVFYSPDSIRLIAEKYRSDEEFIVSPVVTIRDGELKHVPVTGVATLHKNLPFSHTCCVFPAMLFRRFGLYDTKYRIAGDSDFIMRLITNGICYRAIDTPITIMSMAGASNKYILKERMEYCRIFAKHYNKPFAAVLGFLSTFPRWYVSTVRRALK
jgi:glycosyltransferase involved in cell wall biosynthesis